MSGPTGPDEPPRTRRRSRQEPQRGRAHKTARGVGSAWRALSADQKLAAIAAIALLLSMLLPWYQETGNALVNNRLAPIDNSENAFQVYSFVEAAVFVVSAGVLALLYARGHRRAFHLPGGDGAVIMAAGFWVMFLVFYRQLDKPDGRHEGPINTSIGVEWGIFVACLLGALLAFAGFRIRQSHVPEPDPGDTPPPGAPERERRTRLVARRARRADDHARAAHRAHDRRAAAAAAPHERRGARRRRSRRRRARRVPPAAAQALTARISPQVFARASVAASTRGRLHLRPARRALPRAPGTNG